MYAPIYFRIHLIEKLVHFAIMTCSLSTRQKRINVNVQGRVRERGRENEKIGNNERNEGLLSLSISISHSLTRKAIE